MLAGIALILLFAGSVTGMLTVSNMFIEGKFYDLLTTIHAVTVYLWPLHLPFGKFFHIFQRLANLGVWFYKAAGASGPQAACARCGTESTSELQRGDLKAMLPELASTTATARWTTGGVSAQAAAASR